MSKTGGAWGAPCRMESRVARLVSVSIEDRNPQSGFPEHPRQPLCTTIVRVSRELATTSSAPS